MKDGLRKRSPLYPGWKLDHKSNESGGLFCWAFVKDTTPPTTLLCTQPMWQWREQGPFTCGWTWAPRCALES